MLRYLVVALAVLSAVLGLVGCSDPPDGQRDRAQKWVFVRDANSGECLRIDTSIGVSGSQYSQFGTLGVYAVDEKYCEGRAKALPEKW